MVKMLDEARPAIDRQRLIQIAQKRISLLGDKLLDAVAVAAANNLYGTAP